MLLALHVLRAIFPVGSLRQLSFQVFHGQSLATLLRIARTNIGTVTATQTVEHVYLNTECHTVKLLTYSFQCFELSTLLFFSIEHERTDRSVRTNVCTLVTLDTVFSIPFGNECSYTTFFVLSCSLMPSTVFDTLECRNRQQVAILSVDRTNHFVDESRIIVFSLRFIRQIHPCRIDCQLLVFTATVNGREADILRVDEGLMAVLCPAGESTIDFVYQPAGIRLSKAVTRTALVVFAAYTVYFVWDDRKKRKH